MITKNRPVRRLLASAAIAAGLAAGSAALAPQFASADPGPTYGQGRDNDGDRGGGYSPGYDFHGYDFDHNGFGYGFDHYGFGYGFDHNRYGGRDRDDHGLEPDRDRGSHRSDCLRPEDQQYPYCHR